MPNFFIDTDPDGDADGRERHAFVGVRIPHWIR